MANRREYYFKQAVTESELNDGFAQLENADRAIMKDQALVGIFAGGGVSQHSPTPNLTVDVATPCIAYDDFGQRIYVPSPLNVNVAQDSSSTSTAVSGGGNEKWVSVALKFTRALSDPRVDGNSNTIFFVEDESFIVVVTQGAEAAAGTATKPALDPDAVLLADVKRTFGQTQILTANIDLTNRRQDAFVITDTPHSIRAGTNLAAVAAMLGLLNAHILSVGSAHPLSAISSSGVGAWADATANPDTDAQSQIDSIVSTLAASGGTAKIGGAALTAFLDGQQVGAGTLLAQLNAFVSALSSSTASHDGARRIGYDATGTGITGATVSAALSWLDSHKANLSGATFTGAVVIGSTSSLTLTGNGSNSPYTTLTSFQSEIRNFLNKFYATSNVALIALGSLFVSNTPCLQITAGTSAETILIEMDLPPGATVTRVSVTWAGNIAGSGGATQATYEIVSYDGNTSINPSTVAKTSYSSVVTDTHGGTFLQMNTQDITPTSGSFVVDEKKTYFVRMTSYFTASGGSNVEVYRVQAALTPGKLQPR